MFFLIFSFIFSLSKSTIFILSIFILGFFSLSTSLVASALGAWILFGPASAATWGGIGAVIGYALGTAFPMIFLIFLGKKIRNEFPKGSSLIEFMRQKFGKSLFKLILLMTIFYMFIFLCAEVTAVAVLINYISGTELWITSSITLVATLTYTLYGGLRASIFTDAIQMVVILVLLAISVSYLTSLTGNQFSFSFINEKKALADGSGNINVAAHEFLHAVLNKTFNTKENTFAVRTPRGLGASVGGSLFQYLKGLDPNIATNSFMGRLLNYAKQGQEAQGQEVLTLMSDALIDGTFKPNEKTLNTIGDYFISMFESLGTGKLKWKNAKDVARFIKNFNKSIQGDKRAARIVKRAEQGIDIVTEPDTQVEVKKAEEFISSSKFGASLIFKGTVRENNDNKKVTGITYDSHDAMVIKSFEEIYNDVDQKLKIKDKAVYIEHVKGYLGLGEISIIIAVACPHRAETYILSRYIIEEIKKRSPIWKKEHYENEESEWLKGNPVLNEKV